MSTATRLAKLAEGLDSNGVLSAEKGGTGATSLAAVVTSATPAGVSDQTNTSTGYFDLPSGTTGQRPGTAHTGMVRYNSTLSIVETYNGTSWTGLGGSATVSATTPASPTDGAFWLNSETGDLNVYAGGAWILVGGSSGGGASTPNAVSDQANTSTGYFDLPGGTTAQRPATPQTGNIRYNSTTGFAEVYTSAGWGTFGAQPPSISSVLPITYNGEQNTLFTINGADFTADATVKFVDNAGTEYSALIVTFISPNQLTATTPQDFTIAQEPLDVKVLQSSGQVTKLDCIDCGGTPTWTTAAGTVSTLIFPNDTTISSSVQATDPDSGATISYALTTGTLPSGMSFNTSTGAITGTVANPAASSVTTSFDITASDNAGNTSIRTFNIIRKWADGSTQAQANTTAQAIKTLTGTTTSGDYWIKPTGQTAVQLYCDMNMRSKGWAMIAAGRESLSWWLDAGFGDTTTLTQANLSSNTVRYLSKAWIQAYIGGTSWANMSTGLVVKRPIIPDSWLLTNGSGTQTFNWTSWEETPSSISLNITRYTTTDTSGTVSATGSNTTGWTDFMPNNDASRFFTWTWSSHGGYKGIGAGQSVYTGFQSGSEGHAIQQVNIFVN